MWTYAVKRILLGLLTILIVTFVVYLILWSLPDKPYAELINRPNQSPADRLRIIERFGANQPFLVQYWTFLRNVMKPLYTWWGWPPHIPQPPDLGDSLTQHLSVWDSIARRFPNTMILMVSAFVLSLLVAIPIGVISAVKQGSKLDSLVTTGSFFGISLPNYWFGSMLIYAFAIFPRDHGGQAIFPALGMHSNDRTDLLDLGWHLVLPVIVLAVQSIAVYSRYTRGSMLDILHQDYIRTARAKGLGNARIVIRHALRNSLLPLITLLGTDIPQLFVGAVVTEFVFSWPGMGQLFVASAGSNDYAILLGILLILSVLVVVGNLLADLAYTWADPRISYRTRA